MWTRRRRLQCIGWFWVLLVTLSGTVAFAQDTMLGENNQGVLDATQEGINATTNVTVDFTLPRGFVLTGKVDNSHGKEGVTLGFINIKALTETQNFSGRILYGPHPTDPTRFESRYRIVLPADTYELVANTLVDVTPPDAPEGTPRELVIVTTPLNLTVTVAGPTVQDVTIPAPPSFYTVMGTITTADILATESFLRLVSTTGDSSYQISVIDGTYRLLLPPGDYTVSYLASIIPASIASFTSNTVSLRLGVITVSGDQVADYHIPETVTLSGTIQHSNGMPLDALGVTAFVVDEALPPLPDKSTGCYRRVPLYPLIALARAIDRESMDGAYRMPLIPSHEIGSPYNVSVGRGVELTAPIPDIPGESLSALGNLEYPVPGLILNISTDQVQDFVLPSDPPIVVLRGTVLDDLAQPVSGALVFITSDMLTNTPMSAFFIPTLTNEDGTYIVPIYSGTNYAVTVCPLEQSMSQSSDSHGLSGKNITR